MSSPDFTKSDDSVPLRYITLTHRLILPGDANHHQTLFAGSLMRIALEAAYTTAARHIGVDANLVLRRVLSIECYRPVPVGSVIEIRGAALYRARAYLVIGLLGTPLPEQELLWMDALFGFAQVDEQGRPAPLPEAEEMPARFDPSWHEQGWQPLLDRLAKLRQVRERQNLMGL